TSSTSRRPASRSASSGLRRRCPGRTASSRPAGRRAPATRSASRSTCPATRRSPPPRPTGSSSTPPTSPASSPPHPPAPPPPARRAYRYPISDAGGDQLPVDYALGQEAAAIDVPTGWLALFPQGGEIGPGGFNLPRFGQPAVGSPVPGANVGDYVLLGNGRGA